MHLLGLSLTGSRTPVFLFAGVVLPAQWLFSALWLRRYGQEPLELLCRRAAWARRPPLRRS